MAIFDPKAIDPASGLPLGHPSVNASAIQAAQEQGIGIPQDPRQQDARQKDILRNIEQQKLDKAAARKTRQAAIRNRELVSQINAALASGTHVSESVLKQANVPAATIADVQRHQSALKTVKGTPGVQQGGRYDLTRALQSGVSIETLANAGFNPDDIDRAQSASRNGQTPVEAASSFNNLASFPVHAPIGTGRTGQPAARRTPPRKQRKVATANQPPKTKAAQRRYSEALERVQPYIISSRRPQDNAASTLIDVSKALAGGVSHKLLRDLGVPQGTITEAEARQKPNVPDRQRRGASVLVTLRDFIGTSTAGVPTPAPRRRPDPDSGAKLPIPKDIKAGLKDMRKSSRLLGSSFRGAALPVVAHQGAQLELANRVQKGIETGDLTPDEARAAIKEFTATPITSGDPKDLLYIVPLVGTFMSYQDMQRSGEDPLETAFFIVSAATDALILFFPVKAGAGRISVVGINTVRKLTPAIVKRVIARIPPRTSPDAPFFQGGPSTRPPHLPNPAAARLSRPTQTTPFRLPPPSSGRARPPGSSRPINIAKEHARAQDGAAALRLQKRRDIRATRLARTQRRALGSTPRLGHQSVTIPSRTGFEPTPRKPVTIPSRTGFEPTPRKPVTIPSRTGFEPTPRKPVTIPSRADPLAPRPVELPENLLLKEKRLSQERLDAAMLQGQQRQILREQRLPPEARRQVRALGATPRLGDQPITLPSGTSAHVRKLRGSLGEGDITFGGKLTKPAGSEQVGIIIEAQGPPPYPIWGESPMGSMPKPQGPKGGEFVWTVERYDTYIASLKKGGSAPEAIARAEHLRDWAKSKQATEGPVALLEEYQASHPMPTPKSWWERPQAPQPQPQLRPAAQVRPQFQTLASNHPMPTPQSATQNTPGPTKGNRSQRPSK